MSADQLAVAPGLFDRVSQYAKQLSADGLSTKQPLKRDATIVVFCQTFFQQFFEHEFGHEITAVDRQAKEEAAALRIAAEKKRGKKQAVALVRSFEDLCDIWPDVLGFTYGGLTTEFRRFHTTYIPRLLRRAEAWAKASDMPQIEKAAAAASKEWSAAAKRL